MEFTTDKLKGSIESHIRSLYGNISEMAIDSIRGKTNGYSIKGTFNIPWGKSYSFEMELSGDGSMTSFERNEI